jgi:hypothetical protein
LRCRAGFRVKSDKATLRHDSENSRQCHGCILARL